MFDEKTKRKIWDKGRKVEGFSEEIIRKDCCGAWIKYDDYAVRDSDFGWEIDHVYPIAMGGKDDEVNLRPMQWRNNMEKGDDYPTYSALIIADSTRNIEQIRELTVNQKLREKLNELYGEKSYENY